jgi:6-bladed beta-propeller
MRAALVAILLSTAVYAQSPNAAAELRTLLRDTPRLPLERVDIAPHLPEGVTLGTVSSIAADRDGLIYILQRGDKIDPVVVLNTRGEVQRSFGKGMFTVPHSIRVDPDGNIWTVDAGSSVLLKFSPAGKKLQQIDVGEVAPAERCAVPTLCGTTDIAFAPGGRLFISDGYGNARILEYDSSGKRVRVWGTSGTGPGQFQIPHGIAVDQNTIYVADRTNARVQRFDFNGKYLGEWTHLGRPFALKLSGGALWVATMTLDTPRGSPWMLKVDPSSGKVLGQIESAGPHAIDVNGKGELYATGCCGGSNAMSFSWFKLSR